MDGTGAQAGDVRKGVQMTTERLAGIRLLAKNAKTWDDSAQLLAEALEEVLAGLDSLTKELEEVHVDFAWYRRHTDG
jgi:hypothetical protein